MIGIRTLVLTPGETPHRTIRWERAVRMLLCRTCGRFACVRHPSDSRAEVLRHYEADVASERQTILIPAVIRLRRNPPFVQRSVRFNRINVFLRDKFTCAYDGQRYPVKLLTLDHVIPRVQWKGAPDAVTTWTNVVTACKPCNLRKGPRTPKQAGMRLLLRPYEPESLPPMPFMRPERVPDQWLDWLPAPDDEVAA